MAFKNIKATIWSLFLPAIYPGAGRRPYAMPSCQKQVPEKPYRVFYKNLFFSKVALVTDDTNCMLLCTVVAI